MTLNVMSELRMWLCLVVLMGLRIQDSHGWFWYDGKGAQTPGYLTTVRPTSTPGTAGTRASVTEVLKVGEKIGRYVRSGDSFEGSAGEGGSGSEYASGSGSSPFESPESFVPSTNLSGIAVESTNVHAGNFERESNSSQVDQMDGRNTSRFNESIRVSFSRSLAADNVTEHDDGNTTQYSLEYSVSDHLLTNQSDTPRCLPIDSKLPFCTRTGSKSLAVPNFLNQSSVEEVQGVLAEWAWLLRSRCHHSLEWFFCLLLMPRCRPPGLPSPLPCRSFCEVLRDSCWTLLDEGRLPVECHSLPEEKHDGYQCLSVSNQKGNSRLKCHPLEKRDAFSTSITCLSVTSPPVQKGFCLSVVLCRVLLGVWGGIVQPKMKFLSSFTHLHVTLYLYDIFNIDPN